MPIFPAPPPPPPPWQPPGLPFVEWLRAEMDLNGWGDLDMARMMAVAVPSFRNYRRGERKVPAGAAERLALLHFGIDPQHSDPEHLAPQQKADIRRFVRWARGEEADVPAAQPSAPTTAAALVALLLPEIAALLEQHRAPAGAPPTADALAGELLPAIDALLAEHTAHLPPSVPAAEILAALYPEIDQLLWRFATASQVWTAAEVGRLRDQLVADLGAQVARLRAEPVELMVPDAVFARMRDAQIEAQVVAARQIREEVRAEQRAADLDRYGEEAKLGVGLFGTGLLVLGQQWAIAVLSPPRPLVASASGWMGLGNTCIALTAYGVFAALALWGYVRLVRYWRVRINHRSRARQQVALLGLAIFLFPLLFLLIDPQARAVFVPPAAGAESPPALVAPAPTPPPR